MTPGPRPPAPLDLPSPEGRRALVGRVAVESLGGLAFAGRHVQVLRLGGHDVLLTARPRRPGGPPAFVTTDTADVVYETWPPSASWAPEHLDALRTVGRALAARLPGEKRPDPWGATTPTPEDVLAQLPTPAGVRLVRGPRSPKAFAMTAQSATGRVTWRLQTRRPGEPGLLGWRILADELGDPDPATREALRAHVFAQIAAVGSACGLAVPWGAAATRAVHRDVDLGAALDAPPPPGTADPAPPAALVVRVALPSRCECRCTFCVKRSSPALPPAELVLERARGLATTLRPAATFGAPVTLVLVGDDALRAPGLGPLLAALATCAPEEVTLVTPGTELAAPGVIEALVASALPVTIAVTLHGPDAATHDRVAGLPGAFERLCAGLERCQAASVPVQIGHVLTADALDALPRTLQLAASLAPRVHLLHFASEPVHHAPEGPPAGFLAATLPPPSAVRAALEAHRALVQQTVEVLEGFPLCLVPTPLRDRARNDPHSRPDPPPQPPAACARCAAYRTRCGGPEWGLVMTWGVEWLVPLAR